MKKNTNRRVQTPKGENKKMNEAMLGKRSSNAAGPHKLATDYVRKPKHFKGWDY